MKAVRCTEPGTIFGRSGQLGMFSLCEGRNKATRSWRRAGRAPGGGIGRAGMLTDGSRLNLCESGAKDDLMIVVCWRLSSLAACHFQHVECLTFSLVYVFNMKEQPSSIIIQFTRN
ncbi:hypothetical protein CEXT_541561 [Caerostris extrusa]|uniref:Uncharacterized protein n=1 Tax=Caerostris extrusa TaxID=172846 RepID=A0AAV4UNB2_CAEEX|nr:hypothetical protein CEXT_541561 [Caerostris extrusa]